MHSNSMTPPLPSTLHLSPPFLIPPLTPPTLPEADPYIGADMSSSFLVTSALNTTLHIASTLEASFNPLPDASPPLSLLRRNWGDTV